ncbi:hypothetical protein V6Z12_A07G085300 [Gossypium hirsutum]
MDEALLPRKERSIWEILTWELTVEEFKKISFVGAPFMAVAMSQYLLLGVSMMMAGHLGELALSGVAIATAFCNVTGFSLLWGLCGALETLNGQAYGATQYHKLGSYTYCAIICSLPICLPVCLLWMYMDKVLVLIGQDPQVAEIANRYAICLIPGLFGYAIVQSQVRFFQSQSLVLPMMFTSLATLCFHIIVCWILVFKIGFGSKGGALAISFSNWFNVILLGFYMRYSPSCEKTRTLHLKDVFLSVNEFFHFAIPSAVMACLEWWSFEILVLMSGLLPNSKLETSVLSICTRISNELGAGNPQAAQIATLVSMLIALVETLIASTILLCCRHVFGDRERYWVAACWSLCKFSSILFGRNSSRSFMWFCFEAKRGRPLGWNGGWVWCSNASSCPCHCFYKLEEAGNQGEGENASWNFSGRE